PVVRPRHHATSPAGRAAADPAPDPDGGLRREPSALDRLDPDGALLPGDLPAAGGAGNGYRPDGPGIGARDAIAGGASVYVPRCRAGLEASGAGSPTPRTPRRPGSPRGGGPDGGCLSRGGPMDDAPGGLRAR